MPATSKEAIARKAERKRQRGRAATEVVRLELKKSDWPRYKIAARKMRGRLPDMSKQQLREMLAQAARNTESPQPGEQDVSKPTPGQMASMERHKSFHAAIAGRAVPERESLSSKPRGVKGYDVQPRPVAAHDPLALKTVFDTTALQIPEHAVARIIRITAREYRVSVIDILSDRRPAYVVEPRHIAMFFAKERTLRSLPEIGRRFGGRDHTTVLHAVRKIEMKIARDTAFAAEIQRLRDLLSDA